MQGSDGMEAVVCSEFGSGTVQEVERPEVDDDGVLIEVSRVQLSVTECLLYQGEPTYSYERVKERLEAGDGRLFGHEFCGVVREIGDEVQSVEPGDRVYAPRKIPCGECPFCQSGHSYICENKTNIGFHRPGALAEYIALPETVLCTLPDSVSDAEGAAMQPLASSLTCVHDAEINTGDVVAVIGSGVMGYQIGQLARHFGASEVFAIDIDPTKVELAEDAGMVGINAAEENAEERILSETGGIGADVVFEAAGGNQSHGTEGSDPLAQAYRYIRPGGKIVQVGYISSEIELDPRDMRSKYARWVNPLLGVVSETPNKDTGELAVDMVESDRVSIQELVTHELEGLDSFEKAIDITLNSEEYDGLGPAQIVLND